MSFGKVNHVGHDEEALDESSKQGPDFALCRVEASLIVNRMKVGGDKQESKDDGVVRNNRSAFQLVLMAVSGVELTEEEKEMLREAGVPSYC